MVRAMAASLGLACAAHGQLVVAFDDTLASVTTAYEIRVSDGSNAVTPLFSGVDVWGIADDDANRILYIVSGSQLYQWSYDDIGITPTLVGTFMYNGASQAFVGAAFANGKLYCIKNIATEAIYEVDPVTAIATLISSYDPNAYDLGGLDFDESGTIMYATNDDTAPVGSGLFTVDFSGANAVITMVTPYPTGETDIDGLAIGGGRAYLIEDEPGPSIHVYNLVTNAYEASMNTPFATAEVFSAGTWAPGLAGKGCYADCEGDGDLDVFDFLCFQGAYAQQDPYADCEEDGDWDVFDFLCFQGAYANGCD